MSDDVLGLIPFAKTLGLSVIRDGPDEVRIRLKWNVDLCTNNGVLHGGVIMAMADTAGGICAYRNLPPRASGTTTIESKTNFLGGVTSGHISAFAKPIHLGTTLVVVETDVRDSRGNLVARVNQTQLVLSQRRETPSLPHPAQFEVPGCTLSR
jgi:1,4-dihydroxy-2-naphthoyl-CoA hydrolase